MNWQRFFVKYRYWRPELSLKKQFALGMGAMLVPLFVLAGSTFVFFERAVSSFENAENAKLEELFPLVELEHQLQTAKPAIDNFLRNPDNLEYQSHLAQLNRNISGSIQRISDARSITPEKRGLVLGIRQLWNTVYADTTQVASARIKSIENRTRSEKSEFVVKNSEVISQEVDNAISEIYRIEILLSHIQTNDNLDRAKELKQTVRLFIGVISLLAISMALFSALLLSQSVIRSMNTLITGLERIGQGDLSIRIPWRHQDEFGRLARAINRMAEKLAHSQQVLIEIATLDGLTGVYNRREFNRLLSIEVERSRRDGQPVAMVMVDIDHFKAINDTYGHQSGDDALRWVADLLKQEVRPGDIVARYGGEEFALILPKTTPTEAQIVAERIRELMELSQVPIQNHQMISVTASLGCATFPFHGDSEEQLMTAADKALYRAKDSGRNRVCQATSVRPIAY